MATKKDYDELHLAVTNCERIFTLLLSNKRNRHSNKGNRKLKQLLLQMALQEGQIPGVVDYLLYQGADPNIMTTISVDRHNYSYTLLHKAVETRNLEIVKLLLKKGADVNAKTKKGTEPWDIDDLNCYILRYSRYENPFLRRTLTVLEIALINRNEEMIDLILDHGAAVVMDYQVCSLHIALAEGLELSVIEKLVQHGADVNSVSSVKECTPISHAICSYGNANVALYLLDCGANVNPRNETGQAPVHLVNSCEKKLRALLDYGADINAQDEKGNTPFHLAATDESLQRILLLIEYDADVSILNHYGESPLSLATKNLDLAIIFGRNRTLYQDNFSSYILNYTFPSTIVAAFSVILALILREASEKYVDERDLLLLRKEPWNLFYDHFKKELEATKLKKVGANVSCHDILMKGTSVIETYLNKNKVENIKCSDIVEEFPFYADIFASRVRKIKERKILVETSDEGYRKLFRLEYDLPILISFKISSYLSSTDLITLWRVFKRPRASVYSDLFKSITEMKVD